MQSKNPNALVARLLLGLMSLMLANCATGGRGVRSRCEWSADSKKWDCPQNQHTPPMYYDKQGQPQMPRNYHPTAP